MERHAADLPHERGRPLAHAAAEIRRLTAELAEWRRSPEEATCGRLERLQNTLQAVHAVDGQAGRSLTQGSHEEIDDYHGALRTAIQEIEALGRMLDLERDRLSPKLDSGVREREVRNAYARALSKTR
jgi:hypothetical protein